MTSCIVTIGHVILHTVSFMLLGNVSQKILNDTKIYFLTRGF